MPKKKKVTRAFPEQPCTCGGTMPVSHYLSNWQEPCHVVFHCPTCDRSMLNRIGHNDLLEITNLTLQEANILKDCGFSPGKTGSWHRSGLILDKIHSTWYLSADFSSDSYCQLGKCNVEEFPHAFERWLKP